MAGCRGMDGTTRQDAEALLAVLGRLALACERLETSMESVSHANEMQRLRDQTRRRERILRQIKLVADLALATLPPGQHERVRTALAEIIVLTDDAL